MSEKEKVVIQENQKYKTADGIRFDPALLKDYTIDKILRHAERAENWLQTKGTDEARQDIRCLLDYTVAERDSLFIHDPLIPYTIFCGEKSFKEVIKERKEQTIKHPYSFNIVVSVDKLAREIKKEGNSAFEIKENFYIKFNPETKAELLKYESALNFATQDRFNFNFFNFQILLRFNPPEIDNNAKRAQMPTLNSLKLISDEKAEFSNDLLSQIRLEKIRIPYWSNYYKADIFIDREGLIVEKPRLIQPWIIG